jgi:hypothetical protein
MFIFIFILNHLVNCIDLNYFDTYELFMYVIFLALDEAIMDIDKFLKCKILYHFSSPICMTIFGKLYLVR